jgi:hypothetical protein
MQGDNAPSGTAVPASEAASPQVNDLERYKAKLDFWRYVIVSGFAAFAIAAIGPAFQYATSLLQQAKSASDLAAKQEETRQDYVKTFLDKGIQQDIELRLRLADYFASVSPEKTKPGWVDYRDELIKKRDTIRAEINVMERDWRQKAGRSENEIVTAEIERKLAWDYNEVGYVQRDRSVGANPRVSEEVRSEVSSILPQPQPPATCDAGHNSPAAPAAPNAPPAALPNGTYSAERGYTGIKASSESAVCPPRVSFQVTVQNGLVCFDDKEQDRTGAFIRHWIGSIDHSGMISIRGSDATPPTQRPLAITGLFNSATVQSDYCGTGFFRIQRQPG